MSTGEVLRIGDWEARRCEGRLYVNGQVRPVEPKVMDLLFVLASRPDEAFTRDHLTQALWPNTTVGDDSLARCVSKLRKALRSGGEDTVHIETISKRGYRLVVRRSAPPVTAGGTAPETTVGRPLPWAALAILLMGTTIVAGAWIMLSDANAPPPTVVAQTSENPSNVTVQTTTAVNTSIAVGDRPPAAR